MRSLCFLPLLLAACAAAPGEEERSASIAQGFTSNEAVLVDFELDGRLVVDAAIVDPRPLIQAQLLYTVGQLNGDRSVGRMERLELSNVQRIADEVTYHAKLPVAWGSKAIPASYSVTLPARMGESDQARFVSLYGKPCSDPSGGDVDAGRMFLFYRPSQAGCVLDPADVATSLATVTASVENTVGKYPEYARIWDDGALVVVAMFGRADEAPNANDEGVLAYATFVATADQYLRSLQADDARRTTATSADGKTLAATLEDGRTITIDARIVSYRLADDTTFDAWYDARTPRADLVLYNGHAGLGENVRALATKGVFRAQQYVIWSVNGCDTFAYLDRTLADRRAVLNPGDPRGTRYMDTVSNVLGGYFDTTPAMSMTMIRALVLGTQTYKTIFASIDAEQVVVVTGEEDNEYAPATAPTASPSTSVPSSRPSDRGASAPLPHASRAAGCSAAAGETNPVGSSCLLLLVVFAASIARRRSRAPNCLPKPA
jgi:uncharacterized protein (TIGR03382 family)